jgi:hypothetical protein
MPTINQLNAADQLSGSDLLPLYSQANGDARKISLTNLMNWLESQQIATQDNKITQYAAPLTGATVLLTDTQNSVWLVLTPAGTIAELTLKLPLVANCVDRQELLINTTQIVTTLTIDANGSSVVGAPTTLAANGFFLFRWDAVLKTWYRVG